MNGARRGETLLDAMILVVAVIPWFAFRACVAIAQLIAQRHRRPTRMGRPLLFTAHLPNGHTVAVRFWRDQLSQAKHTLRHIVRRHGLHEVYARLLVLRVEMHWLDTLLNCPCADCAAERQAMGIRSPAEPMQVPAAK